MPVVILVSIALGLLRIFGATNQAFQATAHLFLGGVIIAATYDKTNRWTLAGVAIALSVVEVICFFALK